MVDYSRYGNLIAAAKFNVPDSPLRSRDANDVPRLPQSDPARDSVELTRNYPELLLPQSYAPEAFRKVSALKDEATEAAGFERRNDGAEETGENAETGEAEAGGDEAAEAGGETDARGQPLDQREQRQIQEMKIRDQEVKTHEQAHKAAGGRYAGAVSYEYQQGPDGRRYAVGGEVSIDVSPEKDPEATIAKMRQVRSAALAPAEPSPQDRSVAAQASQTEAEARKEVRQQESSSGVEGENDEGSEAGGDTRETTESGAGGRSGETSQSSNRYIGAYLARSADASPPLRAGVGATSGLAAASKGRVPLDVVA